MERSALEISLAISSRSRHYFLGSHPSPKNEIEMTEIVIGWDLR
jgi:hypothetical protein